MAGYKGIGSGGGGTPTDTFDFMDDAPAGIVAILPKSLAEAHPKWEHNMNGQTVPFGFWTDLDAIDDFKVPEVTLDIQPTFGFPALEDADFHTQPIPVSSTATHVTYRTYEFNGLLNEEYETVLNKSDYTFTKTLIRVIPTIANPIKFIAQNGDSWLIASWISDTNLSLFHYNYATNTVTALNGSIANTMQSITIFHYNEDISKFVLQYVNGTTIYTYTSDGATGFVQENTEVATMNTFQSYYARKDEFGTCNYNPTNGLYYVNTFGGTFTEIYTYNSTSLSTNHGLISDPLWIQFAIDSNTDVTYSDGTLCFQRDFENFGQGVSILAVSKDDGVTWDDYRIEVHPTNTPVPEFVMLVASDYALIVQERNATGSTSSVLYKAPLKTGDYEPVVEFNGSNLDKTNGVISTLACAVIDNEITIVISDTDTEAFKRTFRAGEGTTIPLRPEDVIMQPQMTYAIKHTN